MGNVILKPSVSLAGQGKLSITVILQKARI